MLYRHLFRLRGNRAYRKEADRLRPKRRNDNVYRLSSLHINACKIFVLNDHKLALLVLMPLHNLIPRHFLAVGFRHALVINWTMIRLSKEPELQFFALGRWIQRDRNGYQTETDGAFGLVSRWARLPLPEFAHDFGES